MFFPIMTQMEGKQVVVVGGGPVAWRKCALFADYGAAVRAVAPEFTAEFDGQPGIQRVCTGYREELLADADIVVAATSDRALNRSVSEYCRRHRIPVNVVDDPELCSFIVPATVRRGDLTLAVCTGGKSPATAGLIKRQLEVLYGEHMAERLELLGRIRERILASDMPGEEKRSNIINAARLDLEQLRVLKQALESTEA